MRRVVIVGGGISGLSAAYFLSRAGIGVTLVERQGRLGGVIQTERIEGCLVENGPDSFLAQKPWARDLIRELGLEGELIGSNDHLRVTYVLRRGRLVPLPDGLIMMIPTRWLPVFFSPLVGWRTKARMALELFRRPAAGEAPERSVSQFVTEHFGREALEYLAEPLLAGIYGGNPDQLSAASVLPQLVELERKHGSLIRGVLAARRAHPGPRGPLFQTLREGLGCLVELLTQAIRPWVELIWGEAQAVKARGGGYALRIGGHWLEARHVVLACPAWEAARLLEGLDPELAASLAAIPYTSSTTVSLAYREAVLPRRLDGFGFLVPRCERRSVVACTWVGTKFPHRVPVGMILLRCFLTDDSLLGLDDEALAGLVRSELARIMGLAADPVFVRVARWPRSMPQYTVGHRQRMKTLGARLARLPGIYLAGNAYDGIGVPDCVRSGRAAAEAIIAQGLRPAPGAA